MTGNTNSLSATPSQYSGNDRPVEKVSWDDAQIFLTRLNAAEHGGGQVARWVELCFAHRIGMGVRLPGGNDHGVFVGKQHQFYSG